MADPGKPKEPLSFQSEMAAVPSEMPRWLAILAKGPGFVSDEPVVVVYGTTPERMLGVMTPTEARGLARELLLKAAAAERQATAEVPPLPKGWGVDLIHGSRLSAYPVLLTTPGIEHAIATGHARALGLALIHAAAVEEERNRG